MKKECFRDYLPWWTDEEVEITDWMIKQYGVDLSDFMEGLGGIGKERDTSIYYLDVVYHLHSYILDKVKKELNAHQNTKMHPLNEWLEVAGSREGTFITGSAKIYRKVEVLIGLIPKEDRSRLLQTFYSKQF